jgi:hypothetical protein
MAKKVLVQSLFREVVAKVGHFPQRDHRGVAVMTPILRQFWDYKCYCTPEEAEFLVESVENRKMRAAGIAAYFFPAGFPAPVDENYEGALPPPISGDTLTAADPAMALAAKDQMAAAETEMRAREAKTKGSDSAMARQLGQQPVAP